MTFVAKFAAGLILLIHDNVLKLIKTGEADALRWANGGEWMPPSKEFRQSQWFNTVFPVTSIIPLYSDIDQADDDSRCTVTHQFEMLFEDAGPNADIASKSVVKRALAIDQLLRKQGTAATVLAGRDLTKVGAYSLDISRHEYFQVPRGTTMYLQLSTFTVTINLTESRM